MRKEKELYYFGKAITYLFYLYIFGLLLTIGLYLNLEKQFNYVGTIEDSCQDLQTLNDINNKIYPLIDELTVIIFKYALNSIRNSLEFSE